MANVVLNPMFDHVSGAVAKPKKKNGHKCGEYVLLTHRVAPTTNPNCQRGYIKPADNYARKTPVSADEISQRTRFGAIARMVNTRAHDQAKIAQDQAAFKAQTHYTTMRSYLWNVCTTEYYQNLG